MEQEQESIPIGIKLFLYGTLFVIILFILFSTFYIVSAGERGVILTFGKANPVAVTEGLHFKIPIVQSVVKMEVKSQKYEADLTAASNDLQDVATKIAVIYHLSPEQTPTIFSTIGTDYTNRIIYPSEQETNKEVTAQFTAQELITNRQQVRDLMTTKLRDKLQPRGIIVEDVNIIDFKFSESFSSAIEAKVTAEQSALAAKNKLEQIKYEAEQKIASATAEAKALELQKNQVTPELIQLRQIEVQKAMVDKWDGKMPIVLGSSNSFINLDSLIKTQTPTT